MKKILIVDDQEDLLSVYKKVFQEKGYEVETAVDGKDALTKGKEFRPDAIILDLIMPQMSGFQALEEFKQDALTKFIPIIVLTNIYVDASELIAKGAAACLLKVDQTPEQLVERTEEILTEMATKNEK